LCFGRSFCCATVDSIVECWASEKSFSLLYTTLVFYFPESDYPAIERAEERFIPCDTCPNPTSYAHVTHLTVAPLELDYLDVLCPRPSCPCRHADISRSRPLVMAKFSKWCQLSRSLSQAGLNTELSDPNLPRGRPESPYLIIGRP
jgi:hypothetical protein